MDATLSTIQPSFAFAAEHPNLTAFAYACMIVLLAAIVIGIVYVGYILSNPEVISEDYEQYD